MARYIVNMTFEAGTAGEYVEADPALVADWVDAGFLSPVDASGERVTTASTPDESKPSAAMARDVSVDQDEGGG